MSTSNLQVRVTGVQAIADNDPSPEAFDEFIGRYVPLMQQPLVLH